VQFPVNSLQQPVGSQEDEAFVQKPEIQCWPLEHIMPHAPQLFTFDVKSTQVLLQLVEPAGQHFPLEQITSAGPTPLINWGHLLPQVPQFCGSLLKSAHAPLLQHPDEQRAKQPPQLFGSLLVFTHASLQKVCPSGQLITFTQTPFLHACPR
jgi:hypothetical protein